MLGLECQVSELVNAVTRAHAPRQVGVTALEMFAGFGTAMERAAALRALGEAGGPSQKVLPRPESAAFKAQGAC